MPNSFLTSSSKFLPSAKMVTPKEESKTYSNPCALPTFKIAALAFSVIG